MIQDFNMEVLENGEWKSKKKSPPLLNSNSGGETSTF